VIQKAVLPRGAADHPGAGCDRETANRAITVPHLNPVPAEGSTIAKLLLPDFQKIGQLHTVSPYSNEWPPMSGRRESRILIFKGFLGQNSLVLADSYRLAAGRCHQLQGKGLILVLVAAFSDPELVELPVEDKVPHVAV